MTEGAFPDVLQGAVWHTTSLERFREIRCTGWIVAEPNIPDAKRWKTGGGPETYPYVRSLGGVSLFEFRDFDPTSYSQAYPLCSWRTFIPYCGKWEASVWLEIDTATLGREFLSGAQLLARWKAEGALRHTIMPIIEAASLAPIRLAAIRRVLVSSEAEPALNNLQEES